MFAQVTEASIEQKFEGILRLNSNRYYKALSDQVVRVKSALRRTEKKKVPIS